MCACPCAFVSYAVWGSLFLSLFVPILLHALEKTFSLSLSLSLSISLSLFFSISLYLFLSPSRKSMCVCVCVFEWVYIWVSGWVNELVIGFINLYADYTGKYHRVTASTVLSLLQCGHCSSVYPHYCFVPITMWSMFQFLLRYNFVLLSGSPCFSDCSITVLPLS